ncbi:MAG: hypothetical protein CSA21_03920 [Deltaproteobacteria bacterium]|nr:MAG: hypothetical protein CSA21_03920 [Deltaproteobacteria bacterium]
MISRRDFLLSAVRRVRQYKDDTASPAPSQPISDRGQKMEEADRLFAQDMFRQALEAYQHILAHDPSHLTARVQVMICHYRLGEINPAKVCARQIVQKDPDHHVARLYLGLSWLKKGNAEKAFEAWEGYFDMENPLVLREVNLHKALFEAGEELECLSIARDVETILFRKG